MEFMEGYVIKGLSWIGEKAAGSAAEILADILTSPALIVLSIGVYALLQMFSKKLAKLGVVGVFLYGSLLILV